MHKKLLTSFFCLLSGFSYAHSTLAEDDLNELMSMQVEVTSAMKRAQSITDTPAAIFVLERKDIEMSGYSTVPDLMKLLPGLDVRRIDNNQWVISLRSATGKYNSNVMVMLDGRSLSEPAFNGVHWEIISYPIEDIERIELIRGSSGSLWGNNSTNGLVNIITKHSADTQGAFVTQALGNGKFRDTTIRYGGYLNEQLSYRVFLKDIKSGVSHSKPLYGVIVQPFDDKDQLSIGAQFDYALSDELMVKAHYQYDKADINQIGRHINPIDQLQILVPESFEFKVSSANVRVDHQLSTQLKYYLQAYYVKMDRPSVGFKENHTSFAFNSAANLHVNEHFVSWGFDFSRSKRASFERNVLMKCDKITSTSYGVFLQDEYTLLQQRLKFILGARSDYYKQHGWVTSPNVRAIYNITEQSSAWLAWSNGSRVTANDDNHYISSLYIPSFIVNVPLKITLNSADIIDEQQSIEVGYRYYRNSLKFDATIFRVQYKNLFVGSIDALETFLSGEINVVLHNENAGSATGFDLTTSWQQSDNLNLLFGLSYVDFKFASINKCDYSFASCQIALGGDTYDNYQLYTRLQYTFNNAFNMQLTAKHVTEHAVYNTPSYLKFDLSLHWKISDALKLSVVGENLTNSAFVEMRFEDQSLSASSAIGSRYMLKLNYQF